MAPFNIGLTMAGAISAGAYNAGVFDFLIEALDAWYAAKARGDRTAPAHDVVMPVMSGASAGGITGAVGLIALADRAPKADPREPTGTAYLPRVYDAWVKGPKFFDPKGNGPGLLGLDDLKNGTVASLLDTTLLWRIVEDSLFGIKKVEGTRAYLSKSIHLFVTHANLRGVPYQIEFSAGDERAPGYPMTSHGDRRHFRVSGLGSANFESKWADPERVLDLDAKTLENLRALNRPAALMDPKTREEKWFTFAESTLGTGAFPVGLKARQVGVSAQEYRERQWPIDKRRPASDTDRFRLPVKFPDGIGDSSAVEYVTIDGGLINNEPFELARWAIMADPPTKNPREKDKADRAVIMVDPFPEPADWPVKDELDIGLLAIIKKLFPTLKDQARFKLSDMVDALDEGVFSRFLVSPRRWKSKGVLERYGIACGLLGGFGGFLSEAFRAHDFQLGRYNCYRFLQTSFAMPIENTTIADGYRSLAGADRTRYEADNEGNYQIIPLVADLVPPTAPIWPRVAVDDAKEMAKKAAARADAVVGAILKEQKLGWLMRQALPLIWKLAGKGKIEPFVYWTVVKDLILRDQLNGFATTTEDERKMLSALAAPGHDFRTVSGISRDTRLGDTAIAATLVKFSGSLVVEGPLKDGVAKSYTLALRAPKQGWFGSGMSWFKSKLPGGKPDID